jgi:hypothetical protein
MWISWFVDSLVRLIPWLVRGKKIKPHRSCNVKRAHLKCGRSRFRAHVRSNHIPYNWYLLMQLEGKQQILVVSELGVSEWRDMSIRGLLFQ